MLEQPGITIHDVSLPFSAGFPVWPGDPPIEIRIATRIADGADFNTSQIICPSHCCTHVDPPWHIVNDGAKLDDIPLERWIGPCQVASIADDVDVIEPAHLEDAGIAAATTRLLLKTRNSAYWQKRPIEFDTNYTAISASSAHWLIEHNIALLGIDALSFERYDSPHDEVHRIVLGSGIVAIEGLDLFAVEPGFYDLVCLPVNIVGADGAPARVILIEHGAV
jgi:arylformamidase